MPGPAEAARQQRELYLERLQLQEQLRGEPQGGTAGGDLDGTLFFVGSATSAATLGSTPGAASAWQPRQQPAVEQRMSMAGPPLGLAARHEAVQGQFAPPYMRGHPHELLQQGSVQLQQQAGQATWQPRY
jgi:hypothetical protein